MHYVKFLIILVLVSPLFVSCNTNDQHTEQDDTNMDETKQLSTSDQLQPYEIPPVAQQVLDENADVIHQYKAVSLEKDLFIAIEVKSLRQGKEQDIAKKIQKQIQDKLKEKKVNVTSDQKFFIEISKTQENGMKDKEKLKKKLKKWKKLIKDKA